MPITAFFSWQADRPAREGRNLVEEALEIAAKNIAADIAIEEATRDLKIDKDTKGVPGQPPIVETIFNKIDKAAIFVPDLTFVGTRADDRPTPNPNVLIEYGWALKSLSHGRIVAVMNIAYGDPKPESVPFDMRHLRNPILYNCPVGIDIKSLRKERDELAKKLEWEIKIILDVFKPSPSISPPFQEVTPKDGPGKFRLKGQRLGVTHDHSFLRQPEHDIIFADTSLMWLRVIPTVNPGRTWLIKELETAAKSNNMIMPMAFGAQINLFFIRDEDGFGICGLENAQKEITNTVVYAFNTGEIWALDSYWTESQKVYNAIPSVERNFADALHMYAEFLSRLGIKPPYKWVAGMEGIKGRGLFYPLPPGQMRINPSVPNGFCVSDVVTEEGLYTPGDIAAVSIRPFFIKLFDRCGIERPGWLDTP